MNRSSIDLDSGLKGALREIAGRAPPPPSLDGVRWSPHDRLHRSSSVRLRLALAAAAVMTVGGVAATQMATSGHGGGTTVIAPEEGDRDSLSRGVSEPTLGSRRAVDHVAARLTACKFEPGYGAVAVAYERAEVPVLWRGERPEAVTALAGTRTGGVTVLIKQSRFSEAELVAAARRIFRAAAGEIGGAEVAVAVPNLDRSGLVVEVLEPWTGSSNMLVEVAQVPVTIRLVDQAPQPMPDHNPDGGLTRKHTPLEEGITACNKVVLPDEGVAEADFSVNRSDGTLGIHFGDIRRGEYRNVSYVVEFLDDPTCRTTPPVAALIDRALPGWRR